MIDEFLNMLWIWHQSSFLIIHGIITVICPGLGVVMTPAQLHINSGVLLS